MWSLLAVDDCCDRHDPRVPARRHDPSRSAHLVGSLSWVGRPEAIRALAQSPLAWIVGVGGLFGYHALYFLALRFAPPAEAGLLNYLWPLLIVLFSALLPGERLGAGTMLSAPRSGLAAPCCCLPATATAASRPGRCRGWSRRSWRPLSGRAYSVMSRRLKSVPTDAVAGFCAVTALLAALVHAGVEDTVWPGTLLQWLAVIGLGIGPGRSGVLRLGYRNETWRHPRARCGVLRHAAAVDIVPDFGRLRQAERKHRARRDPDRRRRVSLQQRTWWWRKKKSRVGKAQRAHHLLSSFFDSQLSRKVGGARCALPPYETGQRPDDRN